MTLRARPRLGHRGRGAVLLALWSCQLVQLFPALSLSGRGETISLGCEPSPGSRSAPACGRWVLAPCPRSGGAALQSRAPGCPDAVARGCNPTGCLANSPRGGPGWGCALSDRIGCENKLWRTFMCHGVSVFQTSEPEEVVCLQY